MALVMVMVVKFLIRIDFILIGYNTLL